MANHGGAALLIVASLLVAAAAVADARLTAFGGSAVAGEEAAVDATLTCSEVHGVGVGETCFSVAEAAGLTQEQFLGFNPNINCERVFLGQWVCLAATTS